MLLRLIAQTLLQLLDLRPVWRDDSEGGVARELRQHVVDVRDDPVDLVGIAPGPAGGTSDSSSAD